jgi:Maltokinase N-terminal cap domain
MAIIHQAELLPTKLELLEEWLPRRPWFPESGTSGLSKVGSYRFDDPAGEVGIETIIVSAGGSTVQVPLTYRAQPLAGAESWLVGTMQHSVLGRRWVYDACADPIYVTALAASIMLGQPQAKQYLDVKGKLETLAESVFVQSTGPKLNAAPTVSSATPRDTEDGTVIKTADLHLLVVRRLDLEGQPVDPLTLTGIWEGQQESVRLAAVTKA